MERCRICLDSNNLSSIFESAEVAQHITAIACVDVLPNDGLPQYICLLCKHELDISINFKDKCESTFEMLKEQHSKDIQIKENIILNLISEGNDLDETLPKKARECVINCMKNDVEVNGVVLECENETDNIHDEGGNSIKMYKDCYNRNQMEIVESNEDIESSSDIEDEMTENDIDMSESINMCLKCNFYFANEDGLTQHLQRIHPKTMTQCQQCFMYFPNNQVCDDHMRHNHSDTKETTKIVFKCKVCNMGFSQQSELNVHLCLHPGQRYFKCHTCNQDFKFQKTLDNHIKCAHTNKEYTCKYCNKKFEHSDVFKAHLKLHKNVLPAINSNSTRKTHRSLREDDFDDTYICLECNKVFVDASDLISHRRTHIGNKPHICSICQISFYKRNSLEKHLLEHDDIITCTKDETYVYDEDGDDLDMDPEEIKNGPY